VRFFVEWQAPRVTKVCDTSSEVENVFVTEAIFHGKPNKGEI
jgi:hypothetical protein